MLRGRTTKEASVYGIALLILILIYMNRILVLPQGEAVGGLDARGLFYPWLSFARDAVWNGRFPLWDANQFAGYPFLSNPQVAFFYPPTWLAFLLPLRYGLTAINVTHVWLAGMGTYLFMRQQKVDPFPSALASLTFAFSGFTAARIFAGHLGLLGTHAWLPWVLLASSWAMSHPTWQRGVVAGLPLGMAILAGHTASMIYIGLAWIAYYIYLSIVGGEWRLAIRQLLLMVLVGCGLSAVQLLPLVQLTLLSARSEAANLAFASAYSLPPTHLITLLIPDFFGEPTRTGYWSVPNFEELTYYAGMLPLLGLALALRRSNRQIWFWLSLVVVGLLLAFGSYGFLFELAFWLLPPFRLARAPGRAAVLFTFSVSVVLGLALMQWQPQLFANRRIQIGNMMRWLLSVTAVAGIAAIAATGAIFSSQHPSDISGRFWHQIGGWSLALAGLLIGGGLLWAYLIADSSSRKTWLGGGLLIFIIIDLWLFGYKLIRPETMSIHPLWPDAASLIGETDERVLPWGLSIFDQNGAGQVGLKSVFGYNALETGANTALAASVPDPRSTAYDILGARFVLSYSQLDGYDDSERPLTLLGNTANVWVYERARPLPIVRLVSQFEIIPDNGEAIARIHAPDFDPASVVILSKEPSCRPGHDSNGTATIHSQQNGFWEITTDTSEDMLLVISETAYPGWRVWIDNVRAESLIAYTAVRAVCVPAGQHTVTWAYQPSIFMIGGSVTLLMVLLLALAWYRIENRA